MLYRQSLLTLFLCTLALTGCNKTNDVTANQNLDCGEDAIKCIPCEPGEIDCDHATLIVCKEDGKGYAVRAECESAQLCAEGLVLGECEEPLCAAGAVLCVGPVLQLCASGRHRYDLIACESADACLRGIADANCAAVECSESTDCTGEDTQCRRRRCVEGACEVENLASDTACEISGVNGRCDGDGACRASDACTIASDCSGQDTECRLRACQDGVCFLVDLPEGTACATTSVTGACNGEGACLPVAQCTIATDCPGQDTQCQIRACAAGTCLMVPLPIESVCDIGGLGGSCDGEGACAVEADCTIASDCPGEDNACQTRSCADGMCAFSYAAEGVTCSEGGFGGVCTGAGTCRITAQCRADADCPGIVTECQRPRCSGGRCTTTNTSGSCPIGDSIGVCNNGQCQCGTNLTFCAGSCVNLSSSELHCGQCDNACAAGRTCDRVGNCGQACYCPSNAHVCRTPSVDLSLAGTCVIPDSSQWIAAGCEDTNVCPWRD